MSVSFLPDRSAHHVEEEEDTLFPKVAKLVDDDDLDEIGAAMENTRKELLAEGSPRDAVPSETEQAATL